MSLISKAQRDEIRARINGHQWVVYFIVAETLDKVKIGVSKGLQHRIQEMQVGCPELLSIYAFVEVSGRSEAFTLEKKAHKIFNKHHHRGEWFHFTSECKSLIDKQLAMFKKYNTLMSEQEEKANEILEKVMSGGVSEEQEFERRDLYDVDN